MSHAARQFQKILERNAEWHLEVAGSRNMSRHRKDRSAARIGGSKGSEPLRTLAQDRGHGCVTLGVVDRGRCAVEPESRRKRRLEARLAWLALERIEECRLLAANVGAGTHER